MQRLRARLATVLSVAGCVLSLSQVVRADERTDARREFRAGMQAIGDGKYDEGVEHLERAYDILPHPNVLYNIGLAHMYAGRSEQAIDYFERYRETAPASDAVEVDSLISSLQQAKPAETPTQAVAEANPSVVQSGGELSDAETVAAVESAAREIRRLADEQDSALLRKQADDLDRAVARMRERQQHGPSHSSTPASGPAASEPATETQLPHNQIAQQPVIAPEQAGARTGVYEEQVVSASRFSQSPLDAPNATAIITAQDIRMSGQSSLSALLRRIAGVEVTTVTPSHSEVSIRGLNRRSANKVLILWDGRPIRKEFLGTNWPDTLPIVLEDVERIEIIRGPASALYGADAFAGIINIISRAPGTGGNYLSVRGGNRGQGAGAMSFNGRNGDLAYRVSAGVQGSQSTVLVADPSRVDVRNSWDSPERSNLGMSSSGQFDYTLKPKMVASVGGSFNYGDSTLQGISRQHQTVVDDSYESYGFMSLSTPVGLRINSWYNKTGAASNTAYYTIGSLAPRGDRLNQHQAEVDVSWTDRVTLVVPQTLTVGTTYRFKSMEWSLLSGKNEQHHFGVYIQDVLELAKPLRLQVGARMDRHPLLDSLQFSPRGSLVYRFFGEQSIRLSAGRAFRGPSFLESYLRSDNETPVRAVSAIGLGNPKLDPESISSYEIGYQNQESDYFSLEANIYYNEVKDAILLSAVDRYTLSDFGPAGGQRAGWDPINSAFPVSSLSFENERATFRQLGGELGVRLYPVRGLDLYSNYSVHDTSAVDKSRVSAPERANEQQTSRHKVNGGIQYRAPIGLELSADISWLSKQLWIEQVIDTERGVRWQEYDVRPFHILSARVGWRLLNERLELGVVGNNLTMHNKRQHPYGQPFDTRVVGTAKVWF